MVKHGSMMNGSSYTTLAPRLPTSVDGPWPTLPKPTPYRLRHYPAVWLPAALSVADASHSWRNRGAASLLRPDGSVADSFAYTQGPGADSSYCRSSDGSGACVRGCLPTPGQANRACRLLPQRNLRLTTKILSLGQRARHRALRRSVFGRALGAYWDADDCHGPRDDAAGAVGRRSMEDETGGIQIYLRRGSFSALALGDQVRATGWVSEFHGETQIEVSGTRASRIAVSGRGMSLAPRWLRTGEIGEAHEGRLTLLFGRVVWASASGVTLDDGSGPAYIYFPEDLPWQHPYVKLGDMWGAQGVVGQYASQAP